MVKKSQEFREKFGFESDRSYVKEVIANVVLQSFGRIEHPDAEFFYRNESLKEIRKGSF